MAAAARVRPDGDGGVLLDDFADQRADHVSHHPQGIMKRLLLATIAGDRGAVGVCRRRAFKFTAPWRSPDAPPGLFAGKRSRRCHHG